MKLRTTTRRRRGITAFLSILLSVTGLAVVPPQTALADEPAGPVIHMNKHGGPTACKLSATAWDKDGNRLEHRSIYRGSCDGTLQLVPGTRTVTLSGRNWGIERLAGDIHDMKDDWDYCVLVTAYGGMVYTNSSPRGGDCNGD